MHHLYFVELGTRLNTARHLALSHRNPAVGVAAELELVAAVVHEMTAHTEREGRGEMNVMLADICPPQMHKPRGSHRMAQMSLGIRTRSSLAELSRLVVRMALGKAHTPVEVSSMPVDLVPGLYYMPARFSVQVDGHTPAAFPARPAPCVPSVL